MEPIRFSYCIPSILTSNWINRNWFSEFRGSAYLTDALSRVQSFCAFTRHFFLHHQHIHIHDTMYDRNCHWLNFTEHSRARICSEVLDELIDTFHLFGVSEIDICSWHQFAWNCDRTSFECFRIHYRAFYLYLNNLHFIFDQRMSSNIPRLLFFLFWIHHEIKTKPYIVVVDFDTLHTNEFRFFVCVSF